MQSDVTIKGGGFLSSFPQISGTIYTATFTPGREGQQMLIVNEIDRNLASNAEARWAFFLQNFNFFFFKLTSHKGKEREREKC